MRPHPAATLVKLIVNAVGTEHQTLGRQQLRLDPCPGELLRRHAVIPEKAAQRERGGAQNADPADFRVSRHGAQQEIQPHRRAKREQGADELPAGESEKDCFPVFPNFLWNLYLDRLQLLL